MSRSLSSPRLEPHVHSRLIAVLRRRHAPPTRYTSSGIALALMSATFAGANAARAQTSTPPPSSSAPQPQLAPYRAPVIALVQPTAGGTVPRDKPVAVFRFAPGEPDDPLDLGSFRVAVDGRDASAAFQVGAAEAWGSLGDAAFASGDHQLLARLCSVRGACGIAAATVTAIAVAAPANAAAPASSARGRVLDFLIRTTRKLLAP